jgi:histidinol-phosphatase
MSVDRLGGHDERRSPLGVVTAPACALLVATGKLDAFLLQGAGPWDIAALVPIVEEAGGVYSDLSDDRHGDTRTALFSNPALHHQILDITTRTI